MGSSEEEEQPRPSDITVFGANCTLHGLSHIFLPGGVTIRRLLWAAAFLSSLSIFLYQVAGAIMDYLSYPHVTILDEMDSPVMYFPAITMCNYNSFRRSKMIRNDLFWMAGLLGVEQSDFDDFMAALGQPPDNSKFFPSKTFNMLEFLVCGGRSGTLWLPSHHPGGCCTLQVDEEIPPDNVKRFECLESAI
uniref:Uncharacterized protein n=1 Tax=Sinocyclocheilus grahami TaxID=75366 RepID=A0A672RT57_SINGR